MGSTTGRALRIAASAWGYIGWLYLRRLGWIKPAESPAERFARTLESLGTTFIKVGQALVLRRDLLPESYILALQRLQDHVVGFAPALARAEVEQASGRPLKELFGEFEDLPLAAASVAQVHRARLTDGTAVIVKVRRPGIVAAIERDMRLLRLAVRVALLAVPGLRRYRPLDIVAEIHVNLRREMDFRLEARNASHLRRAFEGWDTVMVPAVFEALCTETVMVQELSGGQRIDDPSLRPLGKGLAGVLVDAYLHQFFTLGMFHADPHGGNLFHTPGGRICLHDFGMVGFLNLDTRRNLAALMQAFVNQDADWMLDASLAVGVLGGSIDRDSFRPGLREASQKRTPTVQQIASAQTRAEHEDLAVWYEQEARTAKEKADRHRRMLNESYRPAYGSPYTGASREYGFLRHCENLVRRYDEVVQDTLALAKLHRQLAAEAK